MDDGEYFNSFVRDTIDDDIWKAGHDKFPRSFNASLAPEQGMHAQMRGIPPNPIHHAARGGGIFLTDVGEDFGDMGERGTGPT